MLNGLLSVVSFFLGSKAMSVQLPAEPDLLPRSLPRTARGRFSGVLPVAQRCSETALEELRAVGVHLPAGFVSSGCCSALRHVEPLGPVP